MKKLLACLLLAAMLVTMLAMTACDDDKGEPAFDNSDNSVPTGIGGLGSLPGTSQDNSGTEPNTSQSNPENKVPKDDIMGTFNEGTNTYKNDFIGLSCKVGNEWEVFNREQIAQLLGLTAAMVNNETLAELLTSGQTVIVFYAQKDSGATNINIGLEDLGAMYGSTLDEQQYANLAAPQMAPMLESMGMTGVTTNIETINFAGSEHPAIHVSGSLQGVTLHETAVCIKVGNYMAIITITSTGSPSDCYSMFQGL